MSSFAGFASPKRDVAVFARQLAVLASAGLPLARCLELLGGQASHPALKRAIIAVRAEIEGGAPLAEALARHPRTFSRLFANMVAAGEASGILDSMLARLAELLETNRELARKTRGALVYPAAVAVVAAAAVAVLLAFVIPTFESMFESAGVALPFPTRLVIQAAAILEERWWQLLLASLVGGLALGRWYVSPAGRLACDRLLLRVPLAGELWLKIIVARVFRVLATLTRSGIPIVEGMRMAATVARNRYIHDVLLETRAGIMLGQTIAVPLAATGALPAIAVQMVAAGEESGSLDEMLERIADLYRREAEAALAAFLSSIEPTLAVALGLVVGGVIVSMYLPVFDMAAALGG